MGSMSKPLHTPEPRHRDRRGGVASAQLRSALREPGPPRPTVPTRSVAERRRSYARLAARPARSSFDPAPLVATALLVLVMWIAVVTLT